MRASIVCDTGDPRILVLNADSGVERDAFYLNEDSIDSIAFFSRRPLAILASTTGRAYLWDLERGELLGAWVLRDAQRLFFTPTDNTP